MLDCLQDYQTLSAGEPVGRAVVTHVWGSAPRPEGATMLATASGRIAGSVSGGCVEGAVAEAIAAAISSNTARTLSLGVSDQTAWSVGLACGGSIELLIQPAVPECVLEAAGNPRDQVIASPLTGASVGSSRLVRPGDPPELREAAARTLATAHSGTVTIEGEPVFLEVFARPPRLVIFGAGPVSMALVPLAAQLGFRAWVADGRQTFMAPEKFPGAAGLLLAWPAEAFDQIGLDQATYVCVLTHDPKFDDPAVTIALRSPARYVGVIGSRRTHRARLERLREAGLTGVELARLRGPIGLDLGGRRPVEIALAILAEIVTVRYGGTGAPLGGPVHPPAQPGPETTR